MIYPFNSFRLLLEDHAESLGVQLTDDMVNLEGYIEERARHLARISGERGFPLALLVESDNIALMAGIATVGGGDAAADMELRGFILGALAMLVRTLV